MATALRDPAPCSGAPSGLRRCSLLGGRRSCVSPATPAAQSPHLAPAPGPAPAFNRPPTATEGNPTPDLHLVGGARTGTLPRVPRAALLCFSQGLSGLYLRMLFPGNPNISSPVSLFWGYPDVQSQDPSPVPPP